ncbi:MAG: hypothetical protein QNJ63_31755 [Calothrix sp. MO_192.B10]|nr:hypothetical protein [Calothrix sp. MO_192.B10]
MGNRDFIYLHHKDYFQQYLTCADKEYEAELAARGTTLAAETERLRKAGQPLRGSQKSKVKSQKYDPIDESRGLK